MLTLVVQCVLAVLAIEHLVLPVFQYIIRPLFYNYAWERRFPSSWALVTGASQGAGAALARHLASRGLKVVLVGRPSSRAGLEEVARECELKFKEAKGVKGKVECTRVVCCDLFADAAAAVVTIQRETRDIEDKLHVLVNNLGGSGGRNPFMTFMQSEPSDWEYFAKLNQLPPLLLMKALLPTMVAQNKGAVINIGSASANMPWYVSVYASEKAKLLATTRALAGELLDAGASGVDVGYALCAEIATPMNGYEGPSKNPLIVDVDSWAKDTLKQFGSSVVYTPTTMHRLVSQVLPRVLPAFILETSARQTVRDYHKQFEMRHVELRSKKE